MNHVRGRNTFNQIKHVNEIDVFNNMHLLLVGKDSKPDSAPKSSPVLGGVLTYNESMARVLLHNCRSVPGHYISKGTVSTVFLCASLNLIRTRR